MNQVPPQSSGPMMTPPQKPGERPPQPAAWPTAIGVVGVIFASFAILGGCWGGLSPWIMQSMSSFMPAQQQAGMMSFQAWKWWLVGSSILGLGLGIILLIGSIQILHRKRSGRGLIVCWAVLKIILYATASSVLSYMMTQSAQFQNDPNFANLPPAFKQIMSWMGPIGAVFNFLWYSALPVFMLIWFSRSKIKNEMASWPG